MKFKVDVKELVASLTVAGIVSPTVPHEIPGYLISINADGTGFVYSRGEALVTRAPLTVTDVEGPVVDFLFPSKVVSVFQYIKGTIVFEVSADTVEGNTNVRYYREGDVETGVSVERPMRSPKLVVKCEAEMATAQTTHEYSPALLRVGLDAVSGCAAKKKDAVADGGEHFKIIQVFDDSKPEWAKGDGVLYAADGCRAAYFECPSFKGKYFPLGSEHVPAVLSFLRDREGSIKLRNAENMLFFEDIKGNVLGVQHHVKTHPRYAFYSLDKDRFVFIVQRDDMLNALRQVHAEMADSMDAKKIRVVYDPAKSTLVFQKIDSLGSARSDPVSVPRATTDTGNQAPFTANVNIDHILSLFSNVSCHDVEFRVGFFPAGKKEFAVFRTLDRVWYGVDGKPAMDTTAEGVVECLVTRFMPSME